MTQPFSPQGSAKSAPPSAAALGAWVDAHSDEAVQTPAALWRLALEQFHPVTGDLAFALGDALGERHPVAATLAFARATAQGAPEGLLGQAACHLWAGSLPLAQDTLAAFLWGSPAWRSEGQHVFDGVLRELYLSGHDLPASLRRSVFAYSFVAFRRGDVLAGTPGDTDEGVRAWFLSGLPSATQPQVAAREALALGVAGVAALALAGMVAVGYWPSSLLALWAPFAFVARGAFVRSRARQSVRQQLSTQWRARHGKALR